MRVQQYRILFDKGVAVWDILTHNPMRINCGKRAFNLKAKYIVEADPDYIVGMVPASMYKGVSDGSSIEPVSVEEFIKYAQEQIMLYSLDPKRCARFYGM